MELEAKLKDVLVTDELKKLAGDDAEDVGISITVSDENYRKARDFLLEISLRNHVDGKPNAEKYLYRLWQWCCVLNGMFTYLPGIAVSLLYYHITNTHFILLR